MADSYFICNFGPPMPLKDIRALHQAHVKLRELTWIYGQDKDCFYRSGI